jgi:hypothetical protein
MHHPGKEGDEAREWWDLAIDAPQSVPFYAR